MAIRSIILEASNQLVRNDHYSNRFKLNFLAFGSNVNLVLGPVADAAYSRRGPVSKCHPGTREDVVAELMRLFDKEGGHSICWLFDLLAQ